MKASSTLLRGPESQKTFASRARTLRLSRSGSPRRGFTLVELLAIAAGANGGHKDFFGRHEGQLSGDGGFDCFRIDDQAMGNVHDDLETTIDGEEGLGNREALIR